MITAVFLTVAETTFVVMVKVALAPPAGITIESCTLATDD